MKWIFTFVAACLVGCSSTPPRLTSRSDLKPNVGQMVRVEGTAHYYKIGCPSVACEEFEVFVYPRDSWDVSTQGKKVEVTGRLNDTARTVAPDAYINPGEYWLSDTTWKLVPAEGQ